LTDGLRVEIWKQKWKKRWLQRWEVGGGRWAAEWEMVSN
jgi:hypothetical protein